MSYNDYIERNIFNVLHMNNSYASWEIEPENRAVGYIKGDGGFYIPCDKIHMSQLIGNGSLSSSIEDMYSWYQGIYRINQISSEYQLTGMGAQTGRGSCCMSSAFGIVQQQDFVGIILSNYKDTPTENMLREFMILLQKL